MDMVDFHLTARVQAVQGGPAKISNRFCEFTNLLVQLVTHHL